MEGKLPFCHCLSSFPAPLSPPDCMARLLHDACTDSMSVTALVCGSAWRGRALAGTVQRYGALSSPAQPPAGGDQAKKWQKKKQPMGMVQDSTKTRGRTRDRAGAPLSGSTGGPARGWVGGVCGWVGKVADASASDWEVQGRRPRPPPPPPPRTPPALGWSDSTARDYRIAHTKPPNKLQTACAIAGRSGSTHLVWWGCEAPAAALASGRPVGGQPPLRRGPAPCQRMGEPPAALCHLGRCLQGCQPPAAQPAALERPASSCLPWLSGMVARRFKLCGLEPGLAPSGSKAGRCSHSLLSTLAKLRLA
jgi:hypothetical protein